MSTTTGDRAARRRARTTEPILDAAETLISERGLARTTVDEIASAADVAVGSVYFHFASKDGLYLALVERALEVNEQFMARVDQTLSPLDRVLAAGDAYLAFFLAHPSKFRLIVLRLVEGEHGGVLNDAERRIAQRVGRLVGAVRDDLSAAVAVGQIADTDPDDTMKFLWGTWNGVIALTLRRDTLGLDHVAVVRTLELGKAIVARGLKAPPA